MPDEPSADIRLAVVICTRDRPTSLLATLDSVWSQSRLPDELIIIDDGQLTEQVISIIFDQCRTRGVALQLRPNSSPGLTHGRNFAADIAESDVLLYLDDDVTCDRHCIAEISEVMRDPCVSAVTANVSEPAFNSFPARLYQLGYQIAGWWSVAPRGKPRIRGTGVSPVVSTDLASPPNILRHPEVAVRARWLSGAAMALRRDLVRQYRFDENLTRYALGEDREMGYRLAPNHWLLEARRAHVVHRRETAQRSDSRRLGFMTAYNYLYILNKTCRPGVGQWLLIAWSLCVLGVMHLAWSLVGNRHAHLMELFGMCTGVATWLREKALAASLAARPALRLYGSGNCQLPIASCQLSIVNSPRRRALFVTNRLEPGGAELMLLGLVKHLPARAVDPHILCLKDAGPLAAQCRELGVPVYDGILRYKTDASVIPRIKRLIIEKKIDVVVVAHSGGDRMFWSTLAGGLARAPVVVWSHWFPRAGQRHFEPANRALYRWVDAYVALGERHRAALIRHEHVPAGRIHVIPNAVDLARFVHETSRAEARRRLRLDEHHIGVALIANLRAEKRHDVFIEAARRLSAMDARLRFFIIGDGPHRDAVQALAAESGLDHEILRLMGPRDDVPELLSGLDISCLCSDVECFSVTMLEAAAARCAFVGPNTGCLPEFLEHRRTGLLIRPADANDLTDAIRELSSIAELRNALAEAAHAKVFRDFGLEHMAGAFAGLLHSLRPRPRRRERIRRRALPTAMATGAS